MHSEARSVFFDPRLRPHLLQTLNNDPKCNHFHQRSCLPKAAKCFFAYCYGQAVACKTAGLDFRFESEERGIVHENQGVDIREAKLRVNLFATSD